MNRDAETQLISGDVCLHQTVVPRQHLQLEWVSVERINLLKFNQALWLSQ